MPLSDDDYNYHSTYFGVYSASQAVRVAELLATLGVRYEFIREEQREERLRAWTAWDPTAFNPHEGHELFIHTNDLDKVGTKIVEMYPERKFGKNLVLPIQSVSGQSLPPQLRTGRLITLWYASLRVCFPIAFLHLLFLLFAVTALAFQQFHYQN